MSTLRVNTLQDATGSNQPAMVGAAKAWVNFNGTGTVAIRESFNVSSITDNGTGRYFVNFASAMPDTNFVVVSMSDGDGYVQHVGGNDSTTRTYVASNNMTNGGIDRTHFSVAIFR